MEWEGGGGGKGRRKYDFIGDKAYLTRRTF